MFSVRVQWSDLENYLQREFKQEIVRVLGNGVCFLKSVKHCLDARLYAYNQTQARPDYYK